MCQLKSKADFKGRRRATKRRSGKLKYRIWVLIEDGKVENAIKDLATELDMTERSVRRICSYKYDQVHSINSDQLLIIADYFEVTVDELLNRYD